MLSGLFEAMFIQITILLDINEPVWIIRGTNIVKKQILKKFDRETSEKCGAAGDRKRPGDQ